ncbi:MAG: RNA polymerase sigma factor, partial [Candidatus Hydrogenedens sp.]
MINKDIRTSSNEIQDKELVERIKKGNEEAFDILIKRYYNMVYFTCIKKLYNPDISREATQDIFIKVWKSINTCVDGTYFVSWLMTIARNHCIDILRKERNRKEREISIESFENSDNISPSAFEHSSIDKSL